MYGPNAWLIDEMYLQYSNDPKSVDQEWRDYFENNGAPKSGAAAASDDASKAGKPSAKQSVPANAKVVPPTAESTESKQETRETKVTAAAKEAEAKKADTKPAVKSGRKAPESPMDRIGEAPERQRDLTRRLGRRD